MEAPLPMDRLICGDVGFGKTEIAVRAAAKAVFDGKQVAVLVPTTLLAQQHGETFSERFSGFPVRPRPVALRQRQGAEGDHRRARRRHRRPRHRHPPAARQADVRFKDLGLVVVDEEQRFGVAHKERLKQLRTVVDVLTMTATPIPRTMEMAITGIRDLSTIDTPPEERQPVVTHVGEWDERLAALAVRRELLREGQVFWVHNQVQTIDAAAERVRELVPGARVAVAHGQMDEAALEKVMVRFWQREFDVLVCTTIIESGLDVPNANTLVIERADLLGLAQMYQLRGRVGRSTERGYAYLFLPAEQVDDRGGLQAPRDRLDPHRAWGRAVDRAADLEIRGAGNVLSADQSGHVASVGFEAYAQLMREAVEELRPAATAAAEPGAGDQDRPARRRAPAEGLHRRRGPAARGLPQGRRGPRRRRVKAVREELVDRYGPLPPPAERLLSVAALRAAIRRWGIREVTPPRGAPSG
jgi:transcription-repair coupling factor (superfamily II helicase)